MKLVFIYTPKDQSLEIYECKCCGSVSIRNKMSEFIKDSIASLAISDPSMRNELLQQYTWHTTYLN